MMIEIRTAKSEGIRTGRTIADCRDAMNYAILYQQLKVYLYDKIETIQEM